MQRIKGPIHTTTQVLRRMIVLEIWTKSEMIPRDLDALRWLHQAGMHLSMIQETRHTEVPERRTRIERGTKGKIPIITLHARHWLHWADMHQQQQSIRERLFPPIRHRRSLFIITDPLTNPTIAVALADTVKDPTYFQHRTRPSFRLHTSMTAINSDIALGSQHQHHLNQL